MCAMWQGWTLALRNVVSELLNQGMGYTIESRCLLPLSPPPPSTVCFIYPHQLEAIAIKWFGRTPH